MHLYIMINLLLIFLNIIKEVILNYYQEIFIENDNCKTKVILFIPYSKYNYLSYTTVF